MLCRRVPLILILCLTATTAGAAQQNATDPATAEPPGIGEATGAAENTANNDTGAAPGPLGSPRRALESFVVAMEEKDYRRAIAAMDFSALNPAPDAFQQVALAQKLKASMDRLSLVDPDRISDDPASPPVPLPPEKLDSEIVLRPGDDGQWRFASTTVVAVESLYRLLQQTAPVDQGAELPAAVTQAKPSIDDSQEAAGDAPPETTPAPMVPEGLKSARRTLRSLMDAFEKKDYGLAVTALDFSKLEEQDPEMGPYAKLQTARHLKEVLERLAEIDYAAISDDPEGPPCGFPPESTSPPILIVRSGSPAWRFSADTVSRVDDLHEIYGNRPVLNVPETDKAWYDRELLLGNETWRILALFGAIFTGLLVGQILRAVLRWHADRLEGRGRTMGSFVARTLAAAAVGVLFLAGLTAGMRALVLGHEIESLVTTVIHVIFALVVGYICFRLVDVAVEMLRELATRTGSTLNNMLVPIVRTSLRLTIIVLVALDVATAVSEQPPSAVLAGLGAGGLAIGLAAQDTIKNLFGSVMIFADRPFELGDRIVIDGHDGPVEQVGFRSTRIRTLDGHLVTVPNAEMANKTIHNIGKRPFIRRVVDLRVAPDTGPEKIQEALNILQQSLTDHEVQQADFPPRVFLHDFLDSAINLRAIYWYHPPAYWDYCEFSERFNLQVIERFREAGIRFALPTQRVLLTNEIDASTTSQSPRPT